MRVFLRSKSGRGLLIALTVLVAGSAALAAHHYYSTVKRFEAIKFEESLTALKLVEAFVGSYTEARANALGEEAPVPATFRAHSIERFNGSNTQLAALRINWLGVPGREIRTAPRDDETKAALLQAAQNQSTEPRTLWRSTPTEMFYRTISPSVATQQACVDCHNKHLGGRPPWHLNDVMGAFVIEVPADRFLAEALTDSITVAGLVFTIGAGIFAAIFWLQHKRHLADIVAVTLTERTRMALAARDAAEAANRAKSDFLAMMSHELRTPLNAINGFSEVIANEILGPAPERYRRYAHDIHNSGAHLLSIISDILDMAKADAGRMELTEESISLSDLFLPCLKSIERRAESSGIRIDPTYPAQVLVHGDATKLRQVVINLLTNAVKFTPAGGRVGLDARLTDDGALSIIVRDTGIGIAPSDLARALRPFEQIGSQMHRKHEGTGLGLPLAKALIELHGGSLTLDSNLGEGTRVSLLLPAERVQVTADPLPLQHCTAAAQPMPA